MQNKRLNNLKKYLICSASAAVLASSSSAIAAPGQESPLEKMLTNKKLLIAKGKTPDSMAVKPTDESKSAAAPAMPKNNALLGAIRKGTTLKKIGDTNDKPEDSKQPSLAASISQRAASLKKVNKESKTSSKAKQQKEVKDVAANKSGTRNRKKSLSAPSSAEGATDTLNVQDNKPSQKALSNKLESKKSFSRSRSAAPDDKKAKQDEDPRSFWQKLSGAKTKSSPTQKQKTDKTKESSKKTDVNSLTTVSSSNLGLIEDSKVEKSLTIQDTTKGSKGSVSHEANSDKIIGTSDGDSILFVNTGYKIVVYKSDRKKEKNFNKYFEKKHRLRQNSPTELAEMIAESKLPVGVILEMETYRNKEKKPDNNKKKFVFDKEIGDFSVKQDFNPSNISHVSVDLGKTNYDIDVSESTVLQSIGRNLNSEIEFINTEENRSKPKQLHDKFKSAGSTVKNGARGLKRMLSGDITPQFVPDLKSADINIKGKKGKDKQPIKLALGYNGDGDLTGVGDIKLVEGKAELIFNSNYFNHPSSNVSQDEIFGQEHAQDNLEQKTFRGQITGFKDSDIIVNTDMMLAPSADEKEIEPVYVKHLDIKKGGVLSTSRDLIADTQTDRDNVYLRGALVLKQEQDSQEPVRFITSKIKPEGGYLTVSEGSKAIWQNIDDKGQNTTRTVEFDDMESHIVLRENSTLELKYLGKKSGSENDYFVINTKVDAHPTSALNVSPNTNLHLKGEFNAGRAGSEYTKINIPENSTLDLYGTVNAHIVGDGRTYLGVETNGKDDDQTAYHPVKVSGIIETDFDMGGDHIILTSDLMTTKLTDISSDNDNRFVFDLQEHTYINHGDFRVEGPGTFKITIDKKKIGGIKNERYIDPTNEKGGRKLVVDIKELTESSYNIDPNGIFAELGCELDNLCRSPIEKQGYEFDEENGWVFNKIIQSEDSAPVLPEPPAPAAPVIQSKLGRAELDPRGIAQVISNSLKPIGTLSSAVGSRNLSLASTATAVAAGDDAPSAGFKRKERGIWVTPFYGKATQEKFTGTDGYTSRSSGVTFGVDFDLSDRASIGAAIGLMDTKFKYTGDRAGAEDKASTMLYSIYGNYDMPKGWFMQGMLSYGDTKVKYSDTRTLQPSGAVADITGEFESKSYSGELLFGRNINIKDKLTLTPIIGGKYTRFTEERQREYGQAEYTLSIKDRKISKTEIIAGMRASKLIRKGDMLITPEFDAIVNYRASENKSLLTATSNFDGSLIPSKAEESSRTNLNLGAALTLQKGLFEFKFEYDAYIASKYLGQQGALKVKVHI